MQSKHWTNVGRGYLRTCLWRLVKIGLDPGELVNMTPDYYIRKIFNCTLPIGAIACRIYEQDRLYLRDCQDIHRQRAAIEVTLWTEDDWEVMNEAQKERYIDVLESYFDVIAATAPEVARSILRRLLRQYHLLDLEDRMPYPARPCPDCGEQIEEDSDGWGTNIYCTACGYDEYVPWEERCE